MIQICTKKSTFTLYIKFVCFCLKTLKIKVLTCRLKTHIIPRIPKEGDMVLTKPNHETSLDFFRGAFDLKKHVFIYIRKQIGQKMEGVSASQF